MRSYDSRTHRRDFFCYVFHEYFGGDFLLFSETTGYSSAQARKWISGEIAPRKPTLDYILHSRFAPEFKIVCEFKEIDGEKPTLTQLKKHLGSHVNEPGIYAFYDARAQLLYLGKAVKLLQEVYNALMQRADVVILPSGITNKRRQRWELVTYISAYYVPASSHRDHPKHVESLMLRISKPPLNKQIGKLSKVKRPKLV